MTCRRRCQSPLYSLLSPSPFFPQTGCAAQARDFTKTSTADCVPGTAAATTGTQRYGSNCMTVEWMAQLKLDTGVWPWTDTFESLGLKAQCVRCHLLDKKDGERVREREREREGAREREERGKEAKADSLTRLKTFRPMEADGTFAVSSRPGTSPVKRRHLAGGRN